MTERFTYDRLDRLTGVVEGTDTTGVFVYDDYGRMTSKRLHGAMVFDQALFEADGRPHAIRSARMYANPADLTMDYTSFDKLRLVEQGDRTLSYGYGYEHQRLRMVETDDHDTVRMKEYVGGCERVTEVDGNYSSTHWITFLGGPLGVFAVRDTRMQPPAKQMYYVHPDHLGSWTTVTSWNGNVVQDVWFDPWGTAYDLTTLTDPHPEADSLLFDRGFTGHEHLLGFGLINMNGRVYDPLTSSFLSVDNYVQDHSYTQNFNRYAYCMNNPLKYTDPSGEFLTWSFNHKGFSLGINLTPIGIPIGFGINVSWANGGSVGVYGEIAYRAGGTGFGFGGGFQQSLDYSFKYKSLSTTSSVNAYYSFGCITIGASASYYYNMTYAQGDWGWNIGVGAAWNPNMPYSSYGQSMGFGLGISYGSGGLNYGINGYYRGLSLQDKLDILVDRYKAEMTSAIGDADPQVLVGSNSNFRKNGVAAHNCYGDIWDEKNNVRANGLTEQGIALGIIEIDGQPYASLDSDIYISKNTIRQLWKGSEYGKRTLFHEWVHAHDYYSGQASYWFSLFQDNSVLRIRMETHAYKFVNDYFPNLPPITFHP